MGESIGLLAPLFSRDTDDAPEAIVGGIFIGENRASTGSGVPLAVCGSEPFDAAGDARRLSKLCQIAGKVRDSGDRSVLI